MKPEEIKIKVSEILKSLKGTNSKEAKTILKTCLDSIDSNSEIINYENIELRASIII
jgi:hypothetical protein